MSIGTVLLYALAVIVGIILVFILVNFAIGVLVPIEEALRAMLGIRPRHTNAMNANRWIWENGKAIRKKTAEDQLEIIRKRNAFKESMTDREKAAYEMGVDDGWEDGMEEGRLIGYRHGSHQ